MTKNRRTSIYAHALGVQNRWSTMNKKPSSC